MDIRGIIIRSYCSFKVIHLRVLDNKKKSPAGSIN